MNHSGPDTQPVPENLREMPFWWEAAPLEPDLGTSPPLVADVVIIGAG